MSIGALIPDLEELIDELESDLFEEFVLEPDGVATAFSGAFAVRPARLDESAPGGTEQIQSAFLYLREDAQIQIARDGVLERSADASRWMVLDVLPPQFGMVEVSLQNMVIAGRGRM